MADGSGRSVPDLPAPSAIDGASLSLRVDPHDAFGARQARSSEGKRWREVDEWLGSSHSPPRTPPGRRGRTSSADHGRKRSRVRRKRWGNSPAWKQESDEEDASQRSKRRTGWRPWMDRKDRRSMDRSKRGMGRVSAMLKMVLSTCGQGHPRKNECMSVQQLIKPTNEPAMLRWKQERSIPTKHHVHVLHTSTGEDRNAKEEETSRRNKQSRRKCCHECIRPCDKIEIRMHQEKKPDCATTSFYCTRKVSLVSSLGM